MKVTSTFAGEPRPSCPSKMNLKDLIKLMYVLKPFKRHSVLPCPVMG